MSILKSGSAGLIESGALGEKPFTLSYAFMYLRMKSLGFL